MWRNYYKCQLCQTDIVREVSLHLSSLGSLNYRKTTDEPISVIKFHFVESKQIWNILITDLTEVILAKATTELYWVKETVNTYIQGELWPIDAIGISKSRYSFTQKIIFEDINITILSDISKNKSQHRNNVLLLEISKTQKYAS